MAPGTTGSKNNVLPIWGNDKTMNLNNLILTNIQSSHYFKVNLFELKTYHEVIDEIYYKVAHLEPWEKGSRKTSGQTGMCGGVRGVGAGGIVSTAFCLLYKLFTLKLTRKQVNGLITHCDSPYIRALGFMYVRYTQPPADLWEWFEGYLEDDEELDVKAGGGGVMTIGEMLRHFMTKLEWYSTLFPRIPVPIQKDLEKKLSDYGPFVKVGARNDGVALGAAGGSGGGGSGQDSPMPASPGTNEHKERHIPDEEVSWGEAERIARLRRSNSREKWAKKEDCQNGEKRERSHQEEEHSKDRSAKRSEKEYESRHDRNHRESIRDGYDHSRTRGRAGRRSHERRIRSHSRDRERSRHSPGNEKGHESRSHSKEHHSRERHRKRSRSHDRYRTNEKRYH